MIGAGIAGLSCAEALSNSSARVTVLEARDEIGGRIRTAGDWELGAQVVHGDRNPLWDCLSAPGLEFMQGRADVVVDGAVRPMTRLAPSTAPWSLEQRVGEAARDISVDERLGELDVSDRDRRTAREWIEQQLSGQVDELNTASLSELRRSQGHGHGQFTLAGGYRAVVDRLGHGLDIRTRTPVRTVRWHPGAASLLDDDGHELLSASALVITAPPPVVTAEVLHVEALPEPKRLAAKQLSLGDACCAVLTLAEPAPHTGITFDADGRLGFVRTKQGHRGVLCVSKGRSAAQLRALLLESTGHERLRATLGEVLPWSAGLAIEHVEVADWGREAFIGGAFTFPGHETGHARQQWAASVENTLFFAGEAAAPTADMASVHGARQSGLDAAQDVLEGL